MEIRSYRRVFDLERRIYRIDRLRLNPGGVPVRGVVYFLALLLAVLIARRLPLLEIVATLPPWYLGDLARSSRERGVAHDDPYRGAAVSSCRARAGTLRERTAPARGCSPGHGSGGALVSG